MSQVVVVVVVKLLARQHVNFWHISSHRGSSAVP